MQVFLFLILSYFVPDGCQVWEKIIMAFAEDTNWYSVNLLNRIRAVGNGPEMGEQRQLSLYLATSKTSCALSLLSLAVPLQGKER